MYVMVLAVNTISQISGNYFPPPKAQWRPTGNNHIKQDKGQDYEWKRKRKGERKRKDFWRAQICCVDNSG